MEEDTFGSCGIVYFCASAPEDLSELYHKTTLPEVPQDGSQEQNGLSQVYRNVRSLLDEDQGGFDEVFICSQPKKCHERLDSYANTTETVVLIEIHKDAHEVQDKSFPFLRTLSGDIKGARYQRHVMPFAVLLSDEQPGDTILDSKTTESCLEAGAIDIIHSPLHHEDVNRMTGHIKDIIRSPAKLIGAPMAQNLVDSIRDTSRPPREAHHRPDESLSSERKAAVEKAVGQWHFAAQDFNMDELTYAALCMLEHILTHPELESLGLPRRQLMTLLLATRRQYKHEREVHYHNWRHAVDVTQSIYCFLLNIRICPLPESDERSQYERNKVERLLTSLDGLILLVSAIGHDVGHPGVNNAFLVACNHPLAQTYNDKSVLENYHCAAYSQLLRRHWPSLNNVAGFRAKMISTILATDMQRHFEYMASMGDLKAKVESTEPPIDKWGEKERDNARDLIMALLLKAADISNVARPYEVSAKWAKILMNEFARQGELESELQIPTCLFGGPPDVEDLMAAAQSQKGFMSLFGLPLFQGIAEIMPSINCSIRELERNRKVWDHKIEDEQRRREKEKAERHLTLSSVTDEEINQTTGKHHPSMAAAIPSRTGQELSSGTQRSSTMNTETSPSRRATQDLRQQLASGFASSEDSRSSSPFLYSPAPIFSPQGGSSRRSSKDVALDSIQHPRPMAEPTLSPMPDSRRASQDGEWQVHHSYPNSRRGSKDESLTTILVTSGGTPNRRNSPSSPGKNASSSPGGVATSKRHSVQSAQKQSGPRTSFPSSKSQATTTTAQYSPTTQATSVGAVDGETMPPDALQSIGSTEDPFIAPQNWPNDVEGKRAHDIEGVTSHTDTNGASPPRLTPTQSGDARSPTRKSEPAIRESRSRSRLRGLKFWRKKKDSTTSDTSETTTTSSP